MCKKDSENLFDNIIAITNRHLCERPYLEQIERICRRHPRAVLVREKDLQETEYMELLKAAAKICSGYRVECIAHTYPRSAEKCGIQTVHLPFPLLKEYRETSGTLKRTGTSVHAIWEVPKAERLGADYLIAGHIFSTDCKPGIKPRGKLFLRDICSAAKLPVYAVGGMTATQKCLEEMQSLGAAGICMMSECMRW